MPDPPAAEHIGPPPNLVSAVRARRLRRSLSAESAAAALDSPDSAQGLQLPEPPEGGWRDIGELTFGPRQPQEPEAGVESASNPNDRRQVQNVGLQPFSRICDLLIRARDGSLHTGTGWFISPRTVVTAGHCLFVADPDSPARGFVTSVTVMPARRGETNEAQSLFGWAVAPQGSFRVHDNWQLHGDRDFDYGAIILPPETPLGARTGAFIYGHFNQLDETAPFFSGYPDDVPEGTQWFEQNLIKEVNARRVFYDIFTFRGTSGSPLFFRTQQAGIVACAIHGFGDSPLNSGVRINLEVRDQLNAWLV